MSNALLATVTLTDVVWELIKLTWSLMILFLMVSILATAIRFYLFKVKIVGDDDVREDN